MSSFSVPRDVKRRRKLMTDTIQNLNSNVNPTWDAWLTPEAYQALTGKPASARRALPPDRDALVSEHAAIISSFEDSYIDDVEFCQAFCAVLDMYEAHLDAACDLTDEELDELCFRLFRPRKIGFDRYVKIAKLQKQVKTEIDRGQMLGKKWAFDPKLLD